MKNRVFGRLVLLMLVALAIASCAKNSPKPGGNSSEFIIYDGVMFAEPTIWNLCESGRIGIKPKVQVNNSDYEFEFDFGDDTGSLRSKDNNIVHIYQKPANYNVKLTIYNGSSNVVNSKYDINVTVEKTENCPASVGSIDSGLQEQVYIVVPDEGVASIDSISASINSIGGETLYEYKHVFKGFAVRLTPQEAGRVGALENIASLTRDGEVSIDTVKSWGLDRIDQRNLPLDNTYNAPGDGSGVHVYVIDTGIYQHNDFKGRLGNGYDAIDKDTDPNDCNGHGTHVAGTIGGRDYGVAKNVTLHGVRVLNCQGRGTWASVIAGIDWVTGNHQKPAVANMSLGGGYNKLLNRAVQKSSASGVFYAVAAGNNGRDACTKSPASAGLNSAIMTVGATSNTDQIASFSNQGKCTDIFAPGVAIISSWIGGPDKTRSLRGTSMATPHVAGAAALYLQKNRSASSANVHKALVDSASKGKLRNLKTGSPNSLLYVQTGQSTPQCSITVSPDNVSLQPGQRQEFNAKPKGCGSDRVTWEFNVGSDDGGNNYTTITAPKTPGTYTLTATSVSNPNVKTTARITVTRGITVTITPPSVTLAPGETVTFTAIVKGTDDKRVKWEVGKGGLNSGTGSTVKFTAPLTPGELTIKATSLADPSKYAISKITVTKDSNTCSNGVNIRIAPDSATLNQGEKETFIATVACTQNTNVRWELRFNNGNSTMLTPQQSSGQNYFIFNAVIPDDAVLIATSEADSSKSAQATITVRD